MKKLFFDAHGVPRRGIRLVIALLAVLLAAWAAPLGLTKLFGWLFSVWGVTAENVARAPGWVEWLYGGFQYVSGLAQGVCMTLAAVFAGRALRARVRLGKGLAAGLAAGAMTALTMLGAFCLLDVMRFGHALSRPAVSALTPALIAFGVAQALGAALSVGLIGEVMAGWHRLYAIAGSACAYALLFGRWTPLGLISGGLFGAALWLGREKSGGVAPAFGFLAAYSFLTASVFGMPPWQSGALYETYPVSKPWLTGGDAGPWSGLFMAAALLLFTVVLALPNRRMKAALPPPPARPGRAGKN